MDTNLAATTAARKERLIALRRRKEGAGGTDGGPSHFAFKQRNYDPETRNLAKRTTTTGEDGDETVEKAVEGLAESIIKEDEEKRKEELDLFNIQPKRANWDLKRDMNNRMTKLEKKTNEAIATIFRQRLQSLRKDKGQGQDQVDLVASLNAAEHERDEADAADAAASGSDTD